MPKSTSPKQSKASKGKATEISLMPNDPNKPKPKLKKIIVKNFRAIGETPVEIDLDEIVILVGPNNAGKSSILQAYKLAMNDGQLSQTDFPNGEIIPDRYPEVEVHTIISEDKPGERWIQRDNGEMLIRERWIWYSPGKATRQGFDVIAGQWSNEVPWGAPNVASAYRPKPHSMEAFASPTKQEDEITEMVSSIISDRVKAIQKGDATEEGNAYKDLMKKIEAFQRTVFKLTSSEIEAMEKGISDDLGEIFLNYVIKVFPKEIGEKTYSPFKESFDLLMGPKNGYKPSVSAQGSGARRTLMWAALKYIREHDTKGVERPHVLLLDEPEICLHPSAIRKTRELLYKLSRSPNWQVMVTTHSPIFIDLSHDNTTIVRVERNKDGETISMTLYRSENAQLDPDDRKNLKLLNLCDPYVHEFFFGGRIIIVEGDTEYTAFSYLKMENPDKYGDVHIIRARGKPIIPSLCKILNQFACSYAILHDADTEENKRGNSNSAWVMNDNIMEAVKNSKCANDIIVIACMRNFEDALFDPTVSKKDKPYNAFLEMKKSPSKRKAVEQLLNSLLDPSEAPPENCIRRKITGESDNSQLKSQTSVNMGEQLNLFEENSSD